MNTNDIYLEYARVIKMCEGTELADKPCVCVRWKWKNSDKWFYFDPFTRHPNLNAFTVNQDVDFAVAVLEGKPVFVGDPVFIKIDGYPKVDWDLSQYWCYSIEELSESWTWEPPVPSSAPAPAPKRTFALSGGGQISGYKSGDLPCPTSPSPYREQARLRILGEYFYFRNVAECKHMKKTLLQLLKIARNVSEIGSENNISPKRTFTLNGVELPRPFNMNSTTPATVPLSIGCRSIWFCSEKDKNSVEECIVRILEEARDKP